MKLYVDIYAKFNNFILDVKFETETMTLALLGSSGEGKSLTLKCIAGIITPEKGRIVLNDRVLFDSSLGINVPVHQRNIGYLFQNYALFPNMNVIQNIGVGLRLPKNVKEGQIEEFIDKFHLKGLEKLYPHQLSGGQQQRVALARMLIRKPDLIMLDEPFSALDFHLRQELEKELMLILKQYHKPTILVSHQRDEVYRMSQEIAIIHQGKIIEKEKKEKLFTYPKTLIAARLIGCENFSKIEVKNHQTTLLKYNFTFPIEKKASDVGIKADDIAIDHCSDFKGKVVDIIEDINRNIVIVQVTQTNETLQVHVSKTHLLSIGEEIGLKFDVEKFLWLTNH